jgi:hypothetical protein
MIVRGQCPNFGSEAFDAKGREGLAETAKKSTIELGHAIRESA